MHNPIAEPTLSTETMDLLLQLDPSDLGVLLALDPDERIGGIIRLNNAPRYHNRLNVIELLVRLAEVHQQARRSIRSSSRK